LIFGRSAAESNGVETGFCQGSAQSADVEWSGAGRRPLSASEKIGNASACHFVMPFYFCFGVGKAAASQE
jgi:hypothetical protein